MNWLASKSILFINLKTRMVYGTRCIVCRAQNMRFREEGKKFFPPILSRKKKNLSVLRKTLSNLKKIPSHSPHNTRKQSNQFSTTPNWTYPINPRKPFPCPID